MAEFTKLNESIIKDIVDVGEKEGLLRISGKKIEYLTVKKSYNFSDPEEQVRASFYFELIKKYQYPKERVDLEVIVPRREPSDKADIVVYEDDEKKKPYIVVECKKDGISQAEIKQAIEQAFGNANSLRSKYAILVSGNVRIAFDIAGFPQEEREKNIVADIPVRYGKVIKFKYRKGDKQWDLNEVTRDELLAKFQQCHDTLWEGGKRNPAEAFDEMSKLMFCKIHDERFLTKKGEAYQFQIGTYETITEAAERIKKIYEDAKGRDINVFLEPMKIEDPIIYSVVEILQGISLWKTELDTKGEAYEQFLGGVFKGTMGQYFTPRPIVKFMVDFLEPTDKDIIIDPACGSGGFLIYTLEKVRKDLEEGLDDKDAEYRWREFALKQVFGIEVNSQLARISMMNMIIHDDGHTNIENNDALTYEDRFDPKRNIKLGRFSLLLTNPPFGAVVKEHEKPYLKDYFFGGKVKKRNRQNTEILFTERCLDFLKPGGRMGIVLPDGIITNSSLQDVRDFINDKAQILAVVSLPQMAFKRPQKKGGGDTGSGVKASLLFLRKKKDGKNLPDNYSIFMSIAEHIGYDATGRPDKDEFPDILNAWREFKKENRLDFFVKAPLCFAIGRGETDGRFDPFYLRSIPVIKDIKTKYTIVTLNEILSAPPQYGANERAIEGNPKTDIRYIRITDIDKFGNLKDDWKTAEKAEQKYILEENDILFARSGATAGKCFIFKKGYGKAIFAGYLIRFKINKSKANPSYIFYYSQTKRYSEWIKSIQRPSGQPNINSEEYKSLRIPLPPLPIQDKTTSIMDEAYKSKKEKESEAQKLLNSIEAYVSEALGIIIPKTDEKSPKVFSITADIIKGGRLDPFFYEPRFTVTEDALKRGKYKLRNTGDYLKEIRYGASVKNIYTDDGIPLLRILNLKPNEIDLSEVVRLPKTMKKAIGSCYVEEGDFLISRSGTLGITVVVPKEADGFAYGSFMIRFSITQRELIPSYLCLIMNSQIVREQINKKRIGAVQGNITIPTIKSLLIPVPPLPIQEAIVNEVNKRRKRAKELIKEAEQLLEKAKSEVERLILGEE